MNTSPDSPVPMHPPLILRADANARIGTGHLMRCMALGQAWQDAGRQAEDGGQTTEGSGRVVFITCCENPDLLQRLRNEKFEVIELKNPDEFPACLSSVPRPPSSDPWVVLDGYQFTIDDHRAVRCAGYRLLLIDDCGHLPAYECDLLLNQNLHAADVDYAVNPEARLLLGPDFTLLRREFQPPQTAAEPLPSAGTRLLVTLGGADPDNVTRTVIAALENANLPELRADIVVGPANPHRVSLENAVERSAAQVQLIHSADMAECMRRADVAISAAGSTCWELCRLGVPFVTLTLAENQRGVAAELHDRGIAAALGESPEPAQIAEALHTLMLDADTRARSARAGRTLIDGFGAVRALHLPARDSGLDLFAGRLRLRAAAPEDAALYFQWANDPAVRAHAYRPDPIAWEDHRDWFNRKLRNPDTLLRVLELAGHPVGQVRCDRIDPRTAAIDFSIDARFRGLGLGTRLIARCLEEAFDRLAVDCLRAEVLQDNPASQAVFLKNGFVQDAACDIKAVPSFIYIRRRNMA